MDVLILSPNQITRWNHAHQRMRDGAEKYSGLEVEQVGPGYPKCPGIRGPFKARNFIDLKNPPEFVMTYGQRVTWPFLGIKDLRRKKLHVCYDLYDSIPNSQHTGHSQKYHRLLNRDRYTHFLTHSRREVTWLEKKGFGREHDNVEHWPFAVDEEFFYTSDWRPIDVATLWHTMDLVYPSRTRAEELIVGKAGEWNVQTGRVYDARYARTLSESKIVLNGLSYWKGFNFKIPEVMLAGCLLLTEKWDEYDEMSDLVDGENLVIWDGYDDLMDKIAYYLVHEEERNKIAARGREAILKGYTTKVRGKQFGEIIKGWSDK